jgi:hypothetical protein
LYKEIFNRAPALRAISEPHTIRSLFCVGVYFSGGSRWIEALFHKVSSTLVRRETPLNLWLNATARVHADAPRTQYYGPRSNNCVRSVPSQGGAYRRSVSCASFVSRALESSRECDGATSVIDDRVEQVQVQSGTARDHLPPTNRGGESPWSRLMYWTDWVVACPISSRMSIWIQKRERVYDKHLSTRGRESGHLEKTTRKVGMVLTLTDGRCCSPTSSFPTKHHDCPIDAAPWSPST